MGHQPRARHLLGPARSSSATRRFTARTPNAKMFVLVSDGEAWSGEVAKSLKHGARAQRPDLRRRRRHAVGRRAAGFQGRKGRDRDRPGGADHVHGSIAAGCSGLRWRAAGSISSSIATAIATSPTRSSTPASGWRRRSAPFRQSEDLYWRFLVIASIFPFIGLLFLRDRPELWLQVIGVAAALTVVSVILG